MYRPSELIAKQRRYFASIVEWPRDDRAVLWIVSLLVTLEAFDWRPAVLTVDTPILDAALAALWWFPAAPLVGIATGLATMWAYRFAKRLAVWVLARSIPER